jgi:glutamate 5-kinase
VIPVINENDTVVNDEIKFGDNDTLGALVANLVEADALVILTDQKGLYSRRPAQGPAARVHRTRPWPATRRWRHGRWRGLQHRARRHDHQGTGRQARGGQRRQHRDRLGPRARRAAAPGARANPSARLLVAQTAKKAGAQAMDGSTTCSLRGAVVVDDGAVGKLRDEGKSLLPIGMTAVEGDFSRGDVIAVRGTPHLSQALGRI